MSEPLSFTVPDAAEKAEQLALPGAEECFRAVGLDALPVGASMLNRRQLEFCLAYLKTGSAVKAAEAAGYGDAEAHASKVMKTPAVAAFLAKAISKVASNADKLIERVWQRSAYLHGEVVRLQGENLGDWKKLREAADLANKTDAILATLLGKLTVNVQGSIGVFTAEQRAEILKFQDVLAAPADRRAG